MALLTLARMGNPILWQAAAAVADPGDVAIARLAADMLETMRDAGGVGLAAPQVGIPLRLIVFLVPPERADNAAAPVGSVDGPVPPTVLINPVITPLSPEQAEDWEACLSVPGLVGRVPRFTRIRYHGTGLDGAAIVRDAAGFHARVVQHECDHLDGVLYPMRITDLRSFGFATEIGRPALAGAA